MNERLYRSVDDRVIAGVCGGLAVRLAVDPSLVRIGYAVLAFVTGIVPFVVLYVVMAAVVPEEPTGFAGTGRSPAPPGPGAVPGWTPPNAGPGDPGFPNEPAGVVPFGEEPVTSVAGESVAGESMPAADGGTAGADDPAALATASTGAQWSAQPATTRREARERRRSDPLLTVVGGIMLVCLGIYFLVRDQVTVDWGVVWAAALMALGVVVLVSAFVRPRR